MPGMTQLRSILGGLVTGVLALACGVGLVFLVLAVALMLKVFGLTE